MIRSTALKAMSTAAEERRLRLFDDEERQAFVIVTDVVPELETVVVHSESDNLDLWLGDEVPGVHWKTLRKGQGLKLRIKGYLAPEVLSAQLV